MVLKGRARLYRPTKDALAALKQSIASRRYDVLVGRYLQCAAMAGVFEQRDLPVIVDLDDLDERVLTSRVTAPNTSSPRRLMLRWHASQVASLAKRLRAKAKHVFTASEEDFDFVRHPSCLVLPNIPLPARRNCLAGVSTLGRRQPGRPVRGYLRPPLEP